MSSHALSYVNRRLASGNPHAHECDACRSKFGASVKIVNSDHTGVKQNGVQLPFTFEIIKRTKSLEIFSSKYIHVMLLLSSIP